MVPRNTRTGYVLEQMIIPSLEHGGYTYEPQYNIGSRLGGGLDKHLSYSNLVDIVTLEGFIAKANQGQL